MDEKTEAAIERLVADWPELTEETRTRLRDLLSPEQAAPTARNEWIRRQLGKMPERSEEWKAETLRLWGLRSAEPDES